MTLKLSLVTGVSHTTPSLFKLVFALAAEVMTRLLWLGVRIFECQKFVIWDRALQEIPRLRAVPLFRSFRAGNDRFLGLATWRNAGGGSLRLAVACRLACGFATRFHRLFFTDFLV